MSKYLFTLEQSDRKRYEQKLAGLGFSDVLKDGPLLEGALFWSNWTDDLAKWPSIEFGAIYISLVDSPGPFTRESVEAYKSFDAYNVFCNGWVHACLFRESDAGYYVFKVLKFTPAL